MLDWVCTDTTLTLYHWLKMEDIYANIYVLKCYRESEKVRIDFLRCWAVIKLFARTLSFDHPTLVLTNILHKKKVSKPLDKHSLGK